MESTSKTKIKNSPSYDVIGGINRFIEHFYYFHSSQFLLSCCVVLCWVVWCGVLLYRVVVVWCYKIDKVHTNKETNGGDLVVSVLSFYFDNPSSNPTDAYSFFVKFVFEKNENKQKEAWVGPFLINKQKPEVLSVPLMLLEIEKSMMHFATQIHTNKE